MSKRIDLPPEMMEKYIKMYGNRPTKSANGQINCGCPICREGKSWGKKKRMYYFPEDGFIYCFNCNQSWTTLKWLMLVTGKSFSEIMAEAAKYSFITNDKKTVFFDNNAVDHQSVEAEEDLPEDTITLDSQLQKLYYANNPIVKAAASYIKERRLDMAINVPKYGISLKDRIHRNRLVIPFTDLDGKVAFYQTRKLFDCDFLPKYLSKRDSEKTVFGIDKVDLDFSYLFITEGPIDSCFLKNGISLAGLKYSERQTEQLSDFFTHKKIWVLDNDFKTNATVFEQYEKLLSDGETVFIWPDSMSKYKDINEYCVSKQENSFPTEIIVENSYSGLRGIQLLKGIK